jgi:L-lactate dehydrogenase
MSAASARHDVAALTAFARSLMQALGTRGDIAADVAAILVDGDLLGHTTHGLALLPGYLGEIEKGTMRGDGDPVVVNARAAAQTWDGQRLPGPWLTLRALDAAIAMARTCGTGTVVIKRSHHIACLAAYAKRAADVGMLGFVHCSDPSMKSVAPFGGVSAVFTPNPLSAGIPTSRDPVLLDISASLTTNGLTGRLHKAGEKLPHPWVQDARGSDQRSCGAVRRSAGHAVAAGRPDSGHKGYALAPLVRSGDGGARRPSAARTRPKAGAPPCSCRCWTPPRSAALTRSRGRPIFWSTPVMPPRRGPASRASGYPARMVWRAIASSARRASRCIRRSCRGWRRGVRS